MKTFYLKFRLDLKTVMTFLKDLPASCAYAIHR
ncbi:hypothetical protein EV197_3275 [Aquimarina brevivitae]|uniref:Uncharacterized protein n=1 Tax=Aquimarina brevivitae TaxID=323412 RepID=A0A4Q7NUJ6_9FLAO|nr:hypothetical protein EV197_3275 [Aquimarina brevivitae]